MMSEESQVCVFELIMLLSSTFQARSLFVGILQRLLHSRGLLGLSCGCKSYFLSEATRECGSKEAFSVEGKCLAVSGLRVTKHTELNESRTIVASYVFVRSTMVTTCFSKTLE